VLHLRWPGRDLSLSLRLVGVPTTLVAPQWMLLALTLAPMRIEALELRYADSDWLETVRSLEALGAAVGVRLQRDDAIAAVEARRAEVADDTQSGDKEALLASVDAALRFLRYGGTLILSLTPPRPPSFGEVVLHRQRGVVALAEELGLRIR
jgi:hypothetical protein